MTNSSISRLQEKRHHLPHDKYANQAEQGAADRLGYECAEIPTAHEQRATEVFLQHRAENEAQHERSRIQIEAHEDITDKAKERGNENVVQVAVDAIGADTAEEKNRWEQHTVGDFEYRQPVTHQGHVESNQEAVAHPHAGYQTPEQFGVTGDHVGSRLDALDDEGSHHEGHDSVLGNANAHKRNEAGACGRFIGGGLPGHSFDRA